MVGERRSDGMHEVGTILQRVSLSDDLVLEPAERPEVVGFPEDTLVAAALRAIASAAGVAAGWRVRLEKHIPVAAGLGGGSSDAATALRLANAELADPLSFDELHDLAAELGADVPFFLRELPQLASGSGTDLRGVALPDDYVVVLLLPHGTAKDSTGAVYARFDERRGAVGFEARRQRLDAALGGVTEPRDLASLPPNDLVSSPLAGRLLELGAFRADVSGAGPALYGLFENEGTAQRAGRQLEAVGRTWVVRPV